MIKKFREYLNESEGTLTQEQKNWLSKCTDGTWRVNPSTGLVDVDGDFDCRKSGLQNLMGVRFGRVSGNFDCSNNQLTSLEGAPQEVGKDFGCIFNQLTSRRFQRVSKGRVRVENKDSYRARNGGHSPDEADTLVMIVHLIRMRGEVLPGMVEGPSANRRKPGDATTVEIKTDMEPDETLDMGTSDDVPESLE
jgi:hypothetical protein